MLASAERAAVRGVSIVLPVPGETAGRAAEPLSLPLGRVLGGALLTLAREKRYNACPMHRRGRQGRCSSHTRSAPGGTVACSNSEIVTTSSNGALRRMLAPLSLSVYSCGVHESSSTSSASRSVLGGSPSSTASSATSSLLSISIAPSPNTRTRAR